LHEEREWNCSRKKNVVYQRADKEVIFFFSKTDKEVISFTTLGKNIDELKVGFLLQGISSSLCHSFVIS
jgi:hypothetical protein